MSFPLLPRGEVADAIAVPGLVLLDFWQATCAPCRALEPRLDDFAGQHPGEFTGCCIDVEADPDTPADFAVLSVPTVLVLRDGRERARLDGLIHVSDLKQVLQENRERGR